MKITPPESNLGSDEVVEEAWCETSALPGPTRLHVEHIPSERPEENDPPGVFKVSYRLGDLEHRFTFEGDDEDDIDVLADGPSIIVVQRNHQRGTFSVRTFLDDEQTGQLCLDSTQTARLLGAEISSLSPEEIVGELKARELLCSSSPATTVPQPEEVALREQELAFREETRELLTVVLEPLPESPLPQEPLRVWSESSFQLDLFEAAKKDPEATTTLGYRLFDREHGPRPVFEGTDFRCSPLHPVDSDRTVASLLGFLSLRPGDTDPAHFERYTPVQLEWCERRAGELSMLAHELEQPYRQLRNGKIGRESWNEAADAGRHNRALTLEYSLGTRDHRVTLNGGESDTIETLTDGDDLYVITSNFGLGYLGLEVFSEGALAADIFIDGSHVEACLGEDVWGLSPQEQLERLIEHLPDRPNRSPDVARSRFPTERERIEQVLAGLDDQIRRRIRTFLRLGRGNPWIHQAWDPPFNELSFHVCSDVDELANLILRGNWSLGQAFVLEDICFINQIDGGDEWLTIKGSTAFESITMRTYQESEGEADARLRETIRRIRAASEDQCRRLEY